MSGEKQIEEMAKVLEAAKINALSTIGSLNDGFGMWYATALYNAGCHKQSVGEWVAKHHMSRSSRGRYTSYNTYTCNICGKANGRRKTAFCPYCGAKMKGGGGDQRGGSAVNDI